MTNTQQFHTQSLSGNRGALPFVKEEKHLKVFKRFAALILALVMAAMLAVSAYAATVVVKYKVYVYTSQLTFKQYDYSSSTTPSTRNLTILADSSLGSGSALYHLKYVNGTVAYCIQPGVRSDDSSNYVQGSSGCWYNLPAAVQSGIALALACGYPSAEYGTAYGDSNSSDIIGAEKWAATQAVIWDLICEYRSPYDYRSWGSSPFYNCVDTARYPTFALWYEKIADAMQSASDIPSFAATSSRWCDTIELTKDASGNYSASVTDTNGVLGDFNFASNSGNGITFSQRGNTLTITATAEAAKGLSTEKTYSATGSAYGIDPDEAVLCWYDSTGKYQSLASYTGTGLDPVRAYIKIKATVADEVSSSILPTPAYSEAVKAFRRYFRNCRSSRRSNSSGCSRDGSSDLRTIWPSVLPLMEQRRSH